MPVWIRYARDMTSGKSRELVERVWGPNKADMRQLLILDKVPDVSNEAHTRGMQHECHEFNPTHHAREGCLDIHILKH